MSDEEHVKPRDESLRNSEKSDRHQDNFDLDPSGDGFYYWNDKKYSDGATVCDAQMRYKCWNGKWVDIGNC